MSLANNNRYFSTKETICNTNLFTVSVWHNATDWMTGSLPRSHRERQRESEYVCVCTARKSITHCRLRRRDTRCNTSQREYECIFQLENMIVRKSDAKNVHVLQLTGICVRKTLLVELLVNIWKVETSDAHTHKNCKKIVKF